MTPLIENIKKYISENQTTQVERQIIEWLINNSDDLREQMLKRHNPAYHLFPGQFFDIYLDNYAEQVVSLIKGELERAFPINPEELNLTVTRKWLTMILGCKFLEPIKDDGPQ